MATKQANGILDYLGKIATSEKTRQLSDRELLQRFAQERDEDGFAVLVQRHAPMVLHVCQRVLHNQHDAEEVFQTTFVVLARKAASCNWADSVGSWLYLVAHRLALKAKTNCERRLHERIRARGRSSEDPLSVVSGRELCGALDEELSRLPEVYRAPLVLCCLEGLTRDEAARRLGWSLATLGRRLQKGRTFLRQRLSRRGFPLSAILAALVGTGETAQAALPLDVVQNTVQLVRATTQRIAAPTFPVSPPTAALAHGVLKGMCVFLVVSFLVGLLIPAIQKARGGAERLQCLRNLQQIGRAAHHYHDCYGVLPRIRLCRDASWYNGQDPYCYNDTDGWRYTGPGEIWWAPYDNRPQASAAYALPDYTPQGLLLPFTEGKVTIFRCPLGIDAESGEPLQVSYAWSGITLGPEGKRLCDISNGNGTSQVVTAWEHADGPQCWYGPVHNRTWNPVDKDDPPLHYPLWHPGVCNFLFCDGHTASLVRGDIKKSLFYVNDSSH